MKAEGRSDRETDEVLEALGSLSFSTLPPGERAMARYSLLLTRTPRAVTPADIQELRDTGFDDRAIHDICCVTAYFAFVNRISDGLGVDLEERFEAGEGNG